MSEARVKLFLEHLVVEFLLKVCFLSGKLLFGQRSEDWNFGSTLVMLYLQLAHSDWMLHLLVNKLLGHSSLMFLS